MQNKIIAVVAGLMIAYVSGASAKTPDNTVMDADIHQIELQWEHIKFEEDGQTSQFDDIDKLARSAAAIVTKYPGHVEPLIWEGIVNSEEAGMAGVMSAMQYANKARKILEKAYKMDPSALDAGAPTSLGVLYYRVPGFPIGFGDNDKARQLLNQAVSLAPDGMDANYFYADFLVNRGEYAAADKVLKHALALPPQPDRPLWDRHRRAVIRELIAKAEAN